MTEDEGLAAASPERVEAVERVLEDIAGPGSAVLATIWATVDTERTLADGNLQARDAGIDTLLGARVVVVPGEPPAPPIAIVEPATEGRLAATLARYGEGPAGRYLAVSDDLDGAMERAAAAGVAVSRAGDGPFGRSMLVLLGSATGPHLILCDPAVPSTS